MRGLLGCLMVLTRREVSKGAELLVLQHENAVLRRQISQVCYQPADRLWLSALSRLIPWCRWGGVFPVTSATLFARIERRNIVGGLISEYHRPVLASVKRQVCERERVSAQHRPFGPR